MSARGAAPSRLTPPPLSARGSAATAAFRLAPLLSARGPRTAVSARGPGPTSHALTPSAFQASPMPPAGTPPPACPSPAAKPALASDEGRAALGLSAEDEEALRATFEAFSASNQQGLDCWSFLRLAKAAGLTGRGMTAARVDLLFSAAVPKASGVSSRGQRLVSVRWQRWPQPPACACDAPPADHCRRVPAGCPSPPSSRCCRAWLPRVAAPLERWWRPLPPARAPRSRAPRRTRTCGSRSRRPRAVSLDAV